MKILSNPVPDDASQDLSPALSSLKAKIESLTTPRQTYSSPRDIQPNANTHSILGKDFIDQRVYSRNSPTQLENESSTFDSVAQGNTSHDINKNEGNAMGNIYSEEAHVVGEILSRQRKRHRAYN